MTFDAYILKSISGRGADNPVSLVEIFHYVDAHDKTVMNHSELEGGLRRLIESGKIVECSRHLFCDAKNVESDLLFSGLTVEEHNETFKRYEEWFNEKYRSLK